MVANAVFEGGERPVLHDVMNRDYAPSQGQMKKKGKSLLRWRKKRWRGDTISHSNSIIVKDSEDPVALSVKKFETSTTTSSFTSMPSNGGSEMPKFVSPENDQDDYSVFIVHNYVEGEITDDTKEVKDSLCDLTVSGRHLLDESLRQRSSVLETANNHIPSAARTYKSFDRYKKNVNTSFFDDDISAILTDKTVTFRDSEGDSFLEDDVTSVATQAVSTICAIPKQRMIKNITSVKFARTVEGGSARKFRDDDVSYVTVDVDECEGEFGRHACCFAQQMHGIVMETGDAVYDLVGEPEDYPFGEHLVSVVMQFTDEK
ncbi:hypothetical protein ACHAW6_005541 [Cyclotella cf. meneghiniana]